MEFLVGVGEGLQFLLVFCHIPLFPLLLLLLITISRLPLPLLRLRKWGEAAWQVTVDLLGGVGIYISLGLNAKRSEASFSTFNFFEGIFTSSLLQCSDYSVYLIHVKFNLSSTVALFPNTVHMSWMLNPHRIERTAQNHIFSDYDTFNSQQIYLQNSFTRYSLFHLGYPTRSISLFLSHMRAECQASINKHVNPVYVGRSRSAQKDDPVRNLFRQRHPAPWRHLLNHLTDYWFTFNERLHHRRIDPGRADAVNSDFEGKEINCWNAGGLAGFTVTCNNQARFPFRL